MITWHCLSLFFFFIMRIVMNEMRSFGYVCYFTKKALSCLHLGESWGMNRKHPFCHLRNVHIHSDRWHAPVGYINEWKLCKITMLWSRMLYIPYVVYHLHQHLIGNTPIAKIYSPAMICIYVSAITSLEKYHRPRLSWANMKMFPWLRK